MSRGASKQMPFGAETAQRGLAKLGFHPVAERGELCIIVVGPDANTLCDDLLHLGVIVRPLGMDGIS